MKRLNPETGTVLACRAEGPCSACDSDDCAVIGRHPSEPLEPPTQKSDTPTTTQGADGSKPRLPPCSHQDADSGFCVVACRPIHACVLLPAFGPFQPSRCAIYEAQLLHHDPSLTRGVDYD